jgi:nucleoside-diphosphate-sugar epimerase
VSLGSVFITGATGFVGRHAAWCMVNDGWEVRALVRPGSGPLPRGVATVPAGGLEDREALLRGLDGVDALVHLAARVHVMRDVARDPVAEFRAVNVTGTRRLLELARAAGVRRVVFASSVKAMGEGSAEVWTEETPARPVDPYGVSKLEAEEVVREFSWGAGIDALILRLPMVYGPGMKGNMLRLFRLVERGVPLPFGRIENRRSMLHVDNAVRAFVAALAAPSTGCEVFLCSDDDDVATPELVAMIAAALGARSRLLPVPGAAFRIAGAVGDGLSRLMPFPLTSAALDRLLGSLAVDCGKLKRMTGYRPVVSVREGIDSTAVWYRANRGE